MECRFQDNFNKRLPMLLSPSSLRCDPWQLVTWMERLEALTNLPFELTSSLADGSPPWRPVFEQQGQTLIYRVTTPGGKQFQGQLDAGEGPSPETARRLISLACGQLRAEESETRLDHELGELTTHTLDMYEQISALHDVARQMTLEQDDETVLSGVLATLTGALPARECALISDRDVPRPELPGEDHLRPVVVRHATGSRGSGASASQWLAVRLSEGDSSGSQQWLVAQRDEDSPAFQSEEGLLLQSVATMYDTHLSNRALYEEQRGLLLGFVRSLVATLDARDHYTCGHSERVAAIAALLGKTMGLSREDIDRLHTCGLLHDVGKIGVPDSVLLKAGSLTPEEWNDIRRHPVIGEDILRPLKALDDLRPGVRNHHEAWDGSGYPDGLQGQDIPWMARILAVADAFDAMASDRQYRAGMSLKKVDEILRSGSGQQWCPDVIQAYTACRAELIQIWLAGQSSKNCDEHRA